MRISVENFSKSFGDHVLFKNLNLEFKDKGFYILVGDSGCGKSTLLNIIAMIDKEYEGKYLINGCDSRDISDSEKKLIRATKFGYIFQNFNLFNDDTVLNNISIMLDAVGDLTTEFKRKKLNEVLKLLDIENLKNEYVKNLSGGEKQRVAIARAIITSPEIILCDEPTGALDTINTENVFEILKKISKTTTIICVTHDLESAYKYGDVILECSNKKINIKNKKNQKKYDDIEIMTTSKKKKYISIGISFIFKHLRNKIKSRKVRNFIKSALLTISLVSTGLSFGLTSGLHNSLMNSFNSLVDKNTIVLNKKHSKNTIYDFYSTGEADILRLLNKYKDDLDYYGVNYIVDFENFFPDENDLYLLKSGQVSRVEGFNIRMFNEFIYTKEPNELDCYPKQEDYLKDDEIILSMNYEQMKKMCLELKVERSYEKLGEYLKSNDVMVALRTKNNSWQYSDEQLFRVKGVIMDTLNRVYHSNHLFNKILFEDNMRFPVSNRLNKVEDYPRIFKKVFYVHTNTFQTNFLNKIFYDHDYKNILFDNDNKKYSPLNCSFDIKVTNKLYVYNVFKDTIDIEIIEHLDDLGFDYKNYYFSTPSGYYNNGTSLFSGFAKPMFLSLDLTKIENIIDAHSRVPTEEISNIKVPENVIDGYAFKPSSSNLRLKMLDYPIEPNEIVISEGFRKILGVDDVVGKEIYSALMTSSEVYNGESRNNFQTIKLKIKNVIAEDSSVSIYQNKNFSISLFRDLFKLSAFELIPTSIIFETKHKLSESELKQVNSYFNDYELSNPIHSIEKSIDESTSFLKYLLFGFSGVAIISSIVLLLIITLINAIESRREIAIFTILGFSKFQIQKIFLIDNLLNASVCFCVSISILITISMLTTKLLSSSLGIGTLNLLNPSAIFFNFIILIFICFVSTSSSLIEIKKINLNENLH